VPDFLTTDIDAADYAATIGNTADSYNGFNLVLLDKR